MLTDLIFFINSIITVWVVVAVKAWMDADTLVIFSALKIIRICAGKVAIVRVLTGVGALMRVPIVTCVVVSNDVLKSVAVIIFLIYAHSIDSRTD